MKLEFQLGEWLPDQPKYGVDGLVTCEGVVAQPSGYEFFPGASAAVASVSGTVLGARMFRRTDGTKIVCVGTTTDLFVIVSTTATASSLGLTATGSWVFEQFDTAIYATNKDSGVFYLTDLDTDTSFSAAPGSPPKAKAMARVGDFLVLGNVDDGGTDYPYRIQWSAYNNPQETWGTDIALQSGYQDMPERYGPVTGITSGETALVFQEYATSRLAPGGQAAFQKAVVEESRGCLSPRGFTEFGADTYFVSDDGIYRTRGGAAQNITEGRVWDHMKGAFGVGQIPTAVAAVDWRYRCICFAFKGNGQVYAYNVDTDRWSTFHPAGVAIGRVIFTDYSSNERHLSFFDSTAYKTFTAATAADDVNLETKLIRLNKDGKAVVRQVWPLASSSTAALDIIVRPHDTPASGSGTPTGSTTGTTTYLGTAVDGRYHAINFQASAGESGFQKVFGFQLDFEESGDY